MPRTLNEEQKADEREWRFKNYWQNAERIRERNRRYYYEKKGLPVPEKRKYRLRLEEDRKDLYKHYKEWEEVLKKKEADLKALEKQIKEAGMTPVKTSKVAVPVKEPKPPKEPKPRQRAAWCRWFS